MSIGNGIRGHPVVRDSDEPVLAVVVDGFLDGSPFGAGRLPYVFDHVLDFGRAVLEQEGVDQVSGVAASGDLFPRFCEGFPFP